MLRGMAITPASRTCTEQKRRETHREGESRSTEAGNRHQDSTTKWQKNLKECDLVKFTVATRFLEFPAWMVEAESPNMPAVCECALSWGANKRA